MTKDTGGPAFPGLDYIDYKGKKNPEGMTLRDYFAAKAMQALLGGLESGKEHQVALIPSAAYDLADVMLKAREK